MSQIYIKNRPSDRQTFHNRKTLGTEKKENGNKKYQKSIEIYIMYGMLFPLEAKVKEEVAPKTRNVASCSVLCSECSRLDAPSASTL